MATVISYQVIDNHIGLITLNRPESANAMSRKLLVELNEQITKLNQDPAIRCVILTGGGIKAFCAGADLKERNDMSETEVIETVQLIGETVSNIEAISVPTIAVINGVALGGGLELALACDNRIAADDISVGLPETSLGIIPGAGGTQRLARLIGIAQAKRLIFTAKPITSSEAYTLGLVEEIVERHRLLKTALDYAHTIASNAPIAVKQAKKAINNGMNASLTDGLKVEHAAYKQTIDTEDRIEGLKAFAERREANYVGK